MHRSIKKTANAFTLLEVLLSMAILAALMAAVGLAFDASAKNYTQNEAMFKAMSNARQSLIRVTTDIRTSAKVCEIGQFLDPDTTVSDIDNKMCSLRRTDGIDVTYHFNDSASPASYDGALDDKTLYLKVITGPTVGDYVLARNVTNMTFDRRTVLLDPLDPLTIRVRNVQVLMTVTDENQMASQTLNTAAVVRNSL